MGVSNTGGGSAGVAAGSAARMYVNSPSISINPSSWTKVLFDTIVYDPSNSLVLGAPSSRYVCKVAGIYLVTAEVCFYTPTAGVVINAVIYQTGNPMSQFSSGVVTSGQSPSCPVTATLSCVVNDYIDISCFHQSAAAVNLYNTSGSHNWMAVTRLA